MKRIMDVPIELCVSAKYVWLAGYLLLFSFDFAELDYSSSLVLFFLCFFQGLQGFYNSSHGPVCDVPGHVCRSTAILLPNSG